MTPQQPISRFGRRSHLPRHLNDYCLRGPRLMAPLSPSYPLPEVCKPPDSVLEINQCERKVDWVNTLLSSVVYFLIFWYVTGRHFRQSVTFRTWSFERIEFSIPFFPLLLIGSH
jgi:hypothetical protein